MAIPNYDDARWREARDKMFNAPATLTEDDLRILRMDGGDTEQEARERRATALATTQTKSLDAAPRTETEALAEVVGETVVPFVQRLNVRVRNLNARLLALESAALMTFRGTWVRGRSYQPGDAVVHASALWVCVRLTTGEPGKDFVGFQLALKRGDASK